MICVIYDEKNKGDFFKRFTNKQLTYYPAKRELYANTPGRPTRVFNGQAVVDSNGLISVIGADLAKALMDKGAGDVNNNQGSGANTAGNKKEGDGSEAVGIVGEHEESGLVRSQSDSKKNQTGKGRDRKGRVRNSVEEAGTVNNKAEEA